MKSKKDLAIEFIQAVGNMDAAKLHSLIRREAGDELTQFFLAYSASLIAKDPSKAAQNTSSLMLMGYLIRQNEEGNKAFPHRFQGLGLA